jgi:hypothetical protein
VSHSVSPKWRVVEKKLVKTKVVRIEEEATKNVKFAPTCMDSSPSKLISPLLPT